MNCRLPGPREMMYWSTSRCLSLLRALAIRFMSVFIEDMIEVTAAAPDLLLVGNLLLVKQVERVVEVLRGMRVSGLK